jgi:hypothetical protein
MKIIKKKTKKHRKRSNVPLIKLPSSLEGSVEESLNPAIMFSTFSMAFLLKFESMLN